MDWAVVARKMASSAGAGGATFPVYLMAMPTNVAALSSAFSILGLVAVWSLPSAKGSSRKPAQTFQAASPLDDAEEEIRVLRKAARQITDGILSNLMFRIADYADEGVTRLRKGASVTQEARTLLAVYLPKSASLAKSAARDFEERGKSVSTERILAVLTKLEKPFAGFANVDLAADGKQVEHDINLLEQSLRRYQDDAS